MSRSTPLRRLLGAAAAAGALACAATPEAPSDPQRYRLAASGKRWMSSGADRVLEDLQPRYPEYFAVVLDRRNAAEPDLRQLRADLERHPVDRRNYDALNAIAIGYFELNFQAERERGGSRYMSHSFRAASCLAVPWRAYSEIREPALRDAILDFFEDIARGEKLLSRGTAPRVARIVADLERKEGDVLRRERIRTLVERLTPP